MKRTGVARLSPLLGLLLAGSLLAACVDIDTSDSSSSSEPNVYKEGTSISVDDGAKFVIALTANPSTGYSWQAVENPNAEYVSSKQVSGNSNAVGASGTQKLTFRAISAGSSTLTLNYLRPFEQGVPPAQTATFPVTVK